VVRTEQEHQRPGRHYQDAVGDQLGLRGRVVAPALGHLTGAVGPGLFPPGRSRPGPPPARPNHPTADGEAIREEAASIAAPQAPEGASGDPTEARDDVAAEVDMESAVQKVTVGQAPASTRISIPSRATRSSSIACRPVPRTGSITSVARRLVRVAALGDA